MPDQKLMRVYLRPGPMRRPIPVDVDPAATVGALRKQVGAEALYALGKVSVVDFSVVKARFPLDDSAAVGTLVSPYATLLAAPRKGGLGAFRPSLKVQRRQRLKRRQEELVDSRLGNIPEVHVPPLLGDDWCEIGDDWYDICSPIDVDVASSVSETGDDLVSAVMGGFAATHDSDSDVVAEVCDIFSDDFSFDDCSDKVNSDAETLVFSWGDNYRGQCLASRPLRRIVEPRRVNLSAICSSLCCGGDQSILVTKTGELVGGRFNPERNHSEPNRYCSPIDRRFAAIAANEEFAYGVTDSGYLLTWPTPHVDESSGDHVNKLNKPQVSLLAVVNIATISCGEHHVLILTEAGEVFAAGRNNCGQLGRSANVIESVNPVSVNGRLRGLPIRSVAAGANHSLALALTGVVFAWGENRQGCLGLGALSCTKTTVYAPSLVPASTGRVRYVAAGGEHSAIISQQRGQLLLAGSNSFGQLGWPRSSMTRTCAFISLPLPHEFCVRSVSLGDNHSIALSFEGNLVAFGRNIEGQCGVSTTASPGHLEVVEVPTQITLPHPPGLEKPLVIWACAAGRNHNVILCSPSPDQDEGVDIQAMRKHRRPLTSTGLRVKRQLTRRATFSAVELTEAQQAAVAVETNAKVTALTGLSTSCGSKFAQALGAARGLEDNHAGRDVDTDFSPVRGGGHCALLRRVIQPGATQCPFVAVSMHSLTQMFSRSLTFDEPLKILCMVLSQPSILNASFCFPGLRKTRLDTAGLCRILATVGLKEENVTQLINAAADGVSALSEGPFEDLVLPDQLRALAVYMCLPFQKPVSADAVAGGIGGGRSPRSLLAKIAHLVMRLPASGRIALRNLLADECGDARVFRDFLVPHVRMVADDAIRNTGQQPWLAGALWEVVNQLQLQRPLWEAVLLLQLVASASELAVDLLSPLEPTKQVDYLDGSTDNAEDSDERRSGSNSSSLGSRYTRRFPASLVDAQAFQLQALAEGYIPPEVEFWLFQEHAQFMQITPSEVVHEPWWSDAASMLPRRFCSFMSHANLVPVAFKQRVLQVENILRQRLSQEQVRWPQAEMILSGGRADPGAFFFMISVHRGDLLRQTLDQMYSANPVDLRRPLRVEFIDEEAVDEGGVMREFFRILSQELFSPGAGLFFEVDGSRRLWFCPTLPPWRQLEDYWMVGVIVALAVYNNHPGLDVPLPSSLFKKLKSEPSTQEDVRQLFPDHMKSFEAITSWEPSQPTDTQAGLDAADEEFESLFCLTYSMAPPSPTGPTTQYQLNPGLLHTRVPAPPPSPAPQGGPHSDVSVSAPNEDFSPMSLPSESFTPQRPNEQPLIPGGAETPVIYRGRHKFVQLAMDFLLHSSVKQQFDSFARGFRHVCDSPLLDVLRSEELEAIVAGSTDLDFSTLRLGAQYEGYCHLDPYIEMFWQVLRNFDMQRRRRFLAFCTGSDVAPALGLQDLRLVIQKHGDEPTSRLPVAHTCFNLLLLPRYDSMEKLRACLVTAVEWTEGFGLQ